MKTNAFYIMLILLLIEKIIQHVAVTMAFFFNWKDISSTVAVSPFVLMILGAIVAVLFGLSLWGVLSKQRWGPNLVVALAVFDIIGEFSAQGRVDIVITVSFITATLVLILVFSYLRQLHCQGNDLKGS